MHHGCYGMTWTMVVMEWYVQWLLWNDMYNGCYGMICTMVVIEWYEPEWLLLNY